MSVSPSTTTARKYNTSDPRRPQECVRFQYIRSTWTAPAEMAGFASMAMAALAMLTRYYLWAWLGVFLAVSSIFGQRSLSSQLTQQKTAPGGMYSGWSCLVFTFTALFSIYLPILNGVQEIVRDKPFSLNGGTRSLI